MYILNKQLGNNNVAIQKKLEPPPPERFFMYAMYVYKERKVWNGWLLKSGCLYEGKILQFNFKG